MDRRYARRIYDGLRQRMTQQPYLRSTGSGMRLQAALDDVVHYGLCGAKIPREALLAEKP
jgi:hypothetical protein